MKILFKNNNLSVENPRVTGSIPVSATNKIKLTAMWAFFIYSQWGTGGTLQINKTLTQALYCQLSNCYIALNPTSNNHQNSRLINLSKVWFVASYFVSKKIIQASCYATLNLFEKCVVGM